MRLLGRFVLLGLCFAVAAGLGGCNDRDDDRRDQVGELRVFDEPKTSVAASSSHSDNVPAPAPATRIEVKEVVQVKAAPKMQHVGEIDPFSN